MRYKHNKKRNTAFLYEVLILELAKSVVAKNKELRSKLLETIKKYFNKDNPLGKELKLYKSILSTKSVDNLIAEKILLEAKREHIQLDREEIVGEQNKLYFDIKKFMTPQQIFSNFIPNYKDLASISQIFNKDVSIKTRVLLENDLINKMASNILTENKMQPIDNLVLTSFIKKFNEKYQNLHEEQRILLNKFVTSFSDNGLELKAYLNEEIGRLRVEINKSLSLKEFVDDTIMFSNGKKVLEILNGFKTTPINEQLINQVIKIQNLVREINS